MISIDKKKCENKKMVLTLKQARMNEYRIGARLFKNGVSVAIFFSKEEFENTVIPDRIAIAKFFKVEGYEGELKAGESKVLDNSGKAEISEDLRTILEAGDPEDLLKYIKANGNTSVPNDNLKAVTNSLGIETRQNASNQTLIEALEKFIAEKKASTAGAGSSQG